MTELERALVALGRGLELPPAPDPTAAVGARLERRRTLRRWLVAALALLAALAVAFAVPQARSAILRFFQIRGAQVSIVDRVPFHVLLPDGAWLRYGDRLLVAEIRTGSPGSWKKVAVNKRHDCPLLDRRRQPRHLDRARAARPLPARRGRQARPNTLLWQRGELTLRLEARSIASTRFGLRCLFVNCEIPRNGEIRRLRLTE